MTKVTINSDNGIHARPASQIVAECQKFQSEIYIHNDVQKADCRSIMNLLGMGLIKGDSISIEAIGEDSEAAEKAIARIIEGIEND